MDSSLRFFDGFSWDSSPKSQPKCPNCGLLEQLHRRDAALIRVRQMFAQAAVLLKILEHPRVHPTWRNLWENLWFIKSDGEINGKSMAITRILQKCLSWIHARDLTLCQLFVCQL